MKKRRIILAVALTLMLTMLFSSTAMATIVEPDGTNTSRETALELPRNEVTAVSRMEIDTTRQHVAVGTISPGEEHWYKVFLSPSFDSILSVNADGLHVHVSDENGVPLFDQLVMKDYEEGIRAYDIPVSAAGMYYIRLYGAVYEHEYRVSLGNPNFSLTNITVNASTLTLQPGVTEAETSFSVADEDLPREAVVYQVHFGGLRSARPTNEKRYVQYNGESARQVNAAYLLEYSPYRDIDGLWTIRWTGTAKSVMTLQPEVKLYYVYPILPAVE